MQNFMLYTFLIFGFLISKDVLSKKHDLRTEVIEDKIIGGFAANIKDIPYIARLVIVTDNGAYACGGSIISQRFILTAAHCLPGPKTVYARVGSNHSDKDGAVYTSRAFWQHPNYNSKTLDNDVGLVKLDLPIQFNSNTKPITLARSGINIPAGTEVLASGWGLTSENGQGSDVVRAVRVPVVSNEDCLKSAFTYIADNMICAGVPEGGKSPCSGDSGGPAQSKYGQVGVISFGIGCARPGIPGVFARVSHPTIRGWIKTVTGV